MSLASAFGPLVADGQAGGSSTTSCSHLCPGLPNPCIVTSTVNVVPGSNIDCGTRYVQVTGGDLLVHDGRFNLKAGQLLVSGRTITADCPQGSGKQGFGLDIAGDVTLGTQASLRTSCAVHGGMIGVKATGQVTVGGWGIEANGTAANGPGGTVRITADGALTTTAKIEAKGTTGTAAGGSIELRAASITIGTDVLADGTGSGGGSITFALRGTSRSRRPAS
jgi:hypothetical protein